MKNKSKTMEAWSLNLVPSAFPLKIGKSPGPDCWSLNFSVLEP